MIKIDLITGFLGAGKTTFLKKYARYLMESGCHIGILEHDFGAVNVDMMLLQELEGERCGLEMLAGGCDRETYRRRFRTKLIAMAMSGYDRVLVEPSGIFDTEEFFDVLGEEPLDRWYEPGSVIAVADAGRQGELSREAQFLLASQIAGAGCLILSRSLELSGKEKKEAAERLNRALEQIRCPRKIGREILCLEQETLSLEDFARIAACGCEAGSFSRQGINGVREFKTLYFMNSGLTQEKAVGAVNEVFRDPSCGKVLRVKGFLKTEEGWKELNAVRDGISIRPVEQGQDVLIVIGEELEKERLERWLGSGMG